MVLGMTAKRLLMTGASGLVGGRVAKVLAEGHGFAVTAGQHQAAPPAGVPVHSLDVSSPDSIEAALQALRPDAVVHAAALAEADKCEADPARAFALNVAGPEAMAAACARRGIALVSFSTDLVFPGDKAPCSENDPPLPILTYGKTRLQGEQAVLAAYPAAAIARLALVSGRGYGPRGTATEWLAWALAARRPLRLYTDQYRTPVDSDSVADAVALLVRSRARGLFHLGGPERISRYDLGMRVARVLGLPSDSIEAVRMADHVTGAVRPSDVGLDSARARTELGWTPRTVDDAIRAGRPQPVPL
jgi:dTDP-4-dehydrorhamnose reductase